MTYAHAQPSDARWLARLWRQANGAPFTRAAVQAALAGQAHVGTVACDAAGRGLGGALSLRDRADDGAGVALLVQCAVVQTARRQGIGSGLLAAHIDTLAALDCRDVLLEVRADDAAAVAFYARHGFAALDTLAPDYRQRRAPMLVMGRSLVA